MHTIYAMKSHNNGLWYIGTTVNLRQRVAAHRSRRPELYSNGHTVKIIEIVDTLEQAIVAEAKAILKHKTLWPSGNNRCSGGARGTILKQLIKEHGSTLIPRREEYTCDAIATGIINARGWDVSDSTEQARRRKAWKRHDQGKLPLPGTEHLLERRPIKRGTWKRTEEYKAKLRQSQARYHKKRRAAGQPTHGKGGMLRPHTEKEKFMTASKKIKKRLIAGIPLKFGGAEKAKKLALLRAQKGLDAVPATEIFLTIGSPLNGHRRESRSVSASLRQAWVDHINQWQAKYARDQGWT